MRTSTVSSSHIDPRSPFLDSKRLDGPDAR